MIAVALWVANLPGAVGRISAFGVGPLLICTAGLVVLCLLKTPLRWCGAALIVLASLLAIRTPLPEVLVAADGRAIAVRGADGRLAIHRTGSDAFTIREWLAADGDARLPGDPALREGFKCDANGCVARLADGKLVALVLTPDAFEEDCVRAALVVTAREAPPHCAATAIDRKVSRASGALALTRAGDRWDMQAARPPGQDRPWARVAPRPEETAPSSRVARPTPRDATPRAEDLEPGD
jgi:competence protein ComEC